MNILNCHMKLIQVLTYSKHWWSTEIKKKYQDFARIKRTWKTECFTDKNFWKIKNSLYYNIWKIKKECWKNFLIKKFQNLSEKLESENTVRCWQMLHYMNSQITEIISMLSELKNQVIILIRKKKMMIWNIFFLII